jgi:GTP-binding nuclear protein Ran
MYQEQYYNVAIVGDGGVGKTAFVNGVKNLSFPKQYNPTVGIQVHSIESHDEKLINFWDYAGQEKYNLLKRKQYFLIKA